MLFLCLPPLQGAVSKGGSGDLDGCLLVAAQQAMVIQTPCRHKYKAHWAPGHIWWWEIKVSASSDFSHVDFFFSPESFQMSLVDDVAGI